MHIEDYAFGRIRIDGQTYTADVIIHPDRVHSPWWRAEGHVLAMADLKEMLTAPPRVLVIGTGYDGRMKVPKETLSALRGKGIEVHVLPTREAVAVYNPLAEESAEVAAALHLTC